MSLYSGAKAGELRPHFLILLKKEIMNVISYPVQIIDITPKTVEALVVLCSDKSTDLYRSEVRVFDPMMFPPYVKINDTCTLTVTKGLGFAQFDMTLDPTMDKTVFDKPDYFAGIEDTAFFKGE